MSPVTRLVLQAVSDFVVTSGSTLLGAVMAKEAWGWPTATIWLVAGVTGVVGAFRHVQAILNEPPK